MPNPRYLAAIDRATESQDVDFKSSMCWTKDFQCNRLEILKDVAAMANAGGGLIIIGRDEPDFRSGTIDEAGVASFEPTSVNTFIHRYLAPPIECAVSIEEVGDNRVVVLDVPSIETAPLIFQRDGHCAETKHKHSPHFRRADVYIRSKASESRRVQDPSDMRDLLAIAVRAQRDDIMIGIRREFEAMLRGMRELLEHKSVEPKASAQIELLGVSLPPSPAHGPGVVAGSNDDPKYQAALDQESREFFQPFFYPWLISHGHYDLIVRPVAYDPSRISLRELPSRIRPYTAVINRRGVLETVPYNNTNQIEQYRDGVRLKGRKPEWRRVEAASLQRSGLYRIVRAFPEDFQPNTDGTSATMVDTDRTLWIDHFVETVTLFHMLAALVAQDLMGQSEEALVINFVVDGLDLRRPVGNKPDIDLMLQDSSMGQIGADNRFSFTSIMPARELAHSALELARDRCKDVFWSFGLPETLVPQLQARLIQ